LEGEAGIYTDIPPRRYAPETPCVASPNKKHFKNVGHIRHWDRAAARRLFYIAIHQVSLLSHAATVARRLRIDVHNNNDNDNNENNDNA